MANRRRLVTGTCAVRERALELGHLLHGKTVFFKEVFCLLKALLVDFKLIFRPENWGVEYSVASIWVGDKGAVITYFLHAFSEIFSTFKRDCKVCCTVENQRGNGCFFHLVAKR